MIHPKLKDDALLSDVDEASSDESAFHVWWLGQSGFLLKWGKVRIVFDPYLSDSLTEKYDDTEKPHVRMTERVIDPAQLEGINLVTSSHNHTDHLDAETLLPMTATNPHLQLLLPRANEEFARERLKEGDTLPNFLGINDDESIRLGPFTFTGIAAAHNEVERDEHGLCKYLGFVVQFGGFTVYHSGDTLWHDDLIPALRDFETIDLALLPINGNDPERGVAGNLDGTEAATLARGIGARLVVPCHYEMFEFNTAKPKEFVDACKKLGQPRRVLKAGERLTIDKEEDD